MKQLFSILIIVLGIFSCKKNSIDPETQASNITPALEEATNTSFLEIADLPVQIDCTYYLLHPIGNYKTSKNKGSFLKKGYNSDSPNFSNYSNYNIYGTMSNLMFQHIDSEILTPLTDKKITIKSVTFLKTIFEATKQQFLVYEVFDQDTNQDGELNENDNKTLYISKIDGTNFKKLTAVNRKLINWKIIISQKRLYYKTIQDSNDDNFNKVDTMHYKFVDLNTDDLTINTYNPL